MEIEDVHGDLLLSFHPSPRAGYTTLALSTPQGELVTGNFRTRDLRIALDAATPAPTTGVTVVVPAPVRATEATTAAAPSALPRPSFWDRLVGRVEPRT